jgi:dihydropteroate synthase
MGILNVTPDSFYAGSRKTELDTILQTARRMVDEGATMLDIGGYSSRPGADDIPLEEELGRIEGPVQRIREELPEVIISIDTFRSRVAERAISLGADIVNDISGGQLDSQMFDLLEEAKVPYIMMHMKGTPQTMKQLNQYEDMLTEMMSYFAEKIENLKSRGVVDIIVDPGFGFAKDRNQNFELLHNFEYFKFLERPILAGLSRKSMIFKSLNITQDEALNGTTVLNTVALQKGASILRVHDVKPAVEAIKLLDLANQI